MSQPAQHPVYFGYTGLIDSNGVTRIAAALNQAVNNGASEIHFAFSSLGGYVADGIYLYNHIRGIPAKLVAYNTGSVASIAVAVFVAADERICSPNGMFLIHPTSIGAREGFTAVHLQTHLDSALADDERTERILRERTGLTAELLDARRSRDVHISPEVAVEHGIVSAIGDFTVPQGAQIFQI